MSPYLGDFAEDGTLHFLWNSFDVLGANITRAVNGTISVYKDNGASQSAVGVTDTEDFDSLVGIHAVTIDLSADAFYAIGANYSVVLSAATIDGQVVNAVLADFTIENRFNQPPVPVAAVERIDVPARDRRITIDARDRRVTVKLRNRRIDVSKLH